MTVFGIQFVAHTEKPPELTTRCGISFFQLQLLTRWQAADIFI